MSAFDEGVQVLQIAADKGNQPAKAVLAELEFRQSRIDALHELNSELNTQLRDVRLQLAERPTELDRLFDQPAGYNGFGPFYAITGTNETLREDANS